MKRPALSIGLPVYNGAEYLVETLDSILCQTFRDFELTISDNASTDGTEAICRAYAARDRRVRYVRNEQNIGAQQNWYRVFELSSGTYFAAAAHDDLYAPEYMERCIEVLVKDPSVVVCYSATRAIDERGAVLAQNSLERQLITPIDTVSPKAQRRLQQLLTVDHLCIQLYGVMRASALRQTAIYAGYYGCDRNTLADLCLLGKIQQLPQPMFFHRIYPDALGVGLNTGRSAAELSVVDPGTDWQVGSPDLLVFRHYFAAVTRTRLTLDERIGCYWVLLKMSCARLPNRVRRMLGRRRRLALRA